MRKKKRYHKDPKTLILPRYKNKLSENDKQFLKDVPGIIW